MENISCKIRVTVQICQYIVSDTSKTEKLEMLYTKFYLNFHKPINNNEFDKHQIKKRM